MDKIYLDYQAATPLRPEVREAMLPFFAEHFGNPSSLHEYGLRAREAMDRAREQIAAMIGAASAEEIILTSDGTESANLAVKGAAYAGRRRGKHLVVSEIEHPAVLNSIRFLEDEGFQCTRVAVDRIGLLDPAAVLHAIRDDTVLVALHLVNHDLGTIQPVGEVSRGTAERGIPLFVDAEAAAGWFPIDVAELGADLLSFSLHRCYGPKGVGVLYRRRRTRIRSLIHGGVQEDGRRAGTENIPAIVGAGRAADLARTELPARISHTGELQQRLSSGLRAAIGDLLLNGPEPGAGRVTNNLHWCVKNVEGEGLMLLADLQGIDFASGSSCLGKSMKMSYVLEAIGVDPDWAKGAILLTLGQENSLAEIDEVVAKLPQLVSRLRSLSPATTG